MKTIALRFADTFAPNPGTIELHQRIIDERGIVWYGKLGSKVSQGVIESILNGENSKILLIHSGTTKRYWAYVSDIKYDTPNPEEFPDYYKDKVEDIKTWFCIYRFENAPIDIMSRCTVASSGILLSNSSKHSMSPYFIIHIKEDKKA